MGEDHVSNRTKVSVVMEFWKGEKRTPAELMQALGHHGYDPASSLSI
jgi:hypothetical protein